MRCYVSTSVRCKYSRAMDMLFPCKLKLLINYALPANQQQDSVASSNCWIKDTSMKLYPHSRTLKKRAHNKHAKRRSVDSHFLHKCNNTTIKQRTPGSHHQLKESKWLCRRKVGKSTVSQVYTVLSETKDKVQIMSQHDNEPFNIEECSLLSHFDPNDCISTCHSLQSSRCDGKICITAIDTIIKQDSNGSARRFPYTAITRSRNLDEICLCKCDYWSTVKDHIKNLIQGHIEQDRRRNMFLEHRVTIKEV